MCKNLEKTNDEISRKCQKPGFPTNFRQLQQGKFGQILYIAILHQYAKFHEKYKAQHEKFKKYRFSGENRQFRQFLKKFPVGNMLKKNGF